MLQITYQSDPPGAMFYENGRQWGYTPFTLQYTPDQNFVQGRCMLLRPSMVRWASGAEASMQQLQACGSTGYSQQFVFVRPNIPGRELDTQFYLQLRAQQQEAALALFNAINQQNQQVVQQNQSFSCTSRSAGNTVYTDCR
jgi:hypothetical protein